MLLEYGCDIIRLSATLRYAQNQPRSLALPTFPRVPHSRLQTSKCLQDLLPEDGRGVALPILIIRDQIRDPFHDPAAPSPLVRRVAVLEEMAGTGARLAVLVAAGAQARSEAQR